MLKSVYSQTVEDLVKEIFGTHSKIYFTMVKGGIISPLVRESIKSKGKTYRIKEQKKLFEMCKEEELKLQNVEV